MKCELCGCTVREASARGAYFKRANPKGQAPVWHCSPVCGKDVGTREEAIVRAIKERAPKEEG